VAPRHGKSACLEGHKSLPEYLEDEAILTPDVEIVGVKILFA
jgi:hypothetical protein